MKKSVDLFPELTEVEKKQAKFRGLLSATIINKRHALNMSQCKFAKKLGISQGMVSKLESTEYNMSFDKFIELMEKLDLEYEIRINGKELAAKKPILYANTEYSIPVEFDNSLRKIKTWNGKIEAIA